MNTPTRWDLDILQYGFDLNELKRHMSNIETKITVIEKSSPLTNLNEQNLKTLSEIIKQIESLESYCHCLTTDHIKPTDLTTLKATISMLKSQVRHIISTIQESLNCMSQPQFLDWSKTIHQKRFISDLVIDGEGKRNEVKIISSFAKETLSSLEDMYTQLLNQFKVKVIFEHVENELTFSEANSLAMSHTDPIIRNSVFKELNHTLEAQANLYASIYNQMVGLRLNEYKIKNEDFFDESLKMNGLTHSTLKTMWDVIDSNIDNLSIYLKIKAKEVGKARLSWHEVMSSSEEVYYRINFSQAIDFITKSLTNFDTNISTFVHEIIIRGWVDAEQRNTKPINGFCAPFPYEGESRISLNYDESIDSARRLAHELGHAWHFQQIGLIPSLRFSEEFFEMTMAETSSIFFETIFIDYVIQEIKDPSTKKAILGSKIERSLNYLMSIRGAYLFEEKFYEYRKNGQLDVNMVEELSIKCQEKAYGNSLSEYEPFVWIKYDQFYQADTPFYNYPYSFGFLLSIGLIELAKDDEHFHKKFQQFLAETGMLPLEQLIKKHFNIDLSEQNFWQQSIQRLLKYIELYNNC
ncbi:peptidase M3 [Bacillus weihaiensis]|uniref:peptidase M3 n=1 Tax=Bacillus weihaiensis TaxID=1547283 RepID=UPI002354BBA9|nr:peptidase M3 [Bacillus weihaiensis]